MRWTPILQSLGASPPWNCSRSGLEWRQDTYTDYAVWYDIVNERAEPSWGQVDTVDNKKARARYFQSRFVAHLASRLALSFNSGHSFYETSHPGRKFTVFSHHEVITLGHSHAGRPRGVLLLCYFHRVFLRVFLRVPLRVFLRVFLCVHSHRV